MLTCFFLRPALNKCPNDHVLAPRLQPPLLNRAIPYHSPHLRMSRKQRLPRMAPRSKRRYHGTSAKKKPKNQRSLSLNVQILPIVGKDGRIETKVGFNLIAWKNTSDFRRGTNAIEMQSQIMRLVLQRKPWLMNPKLCNPVQARQLLL